MKRWLIIIALASMVAMLALLPACASLVPMVWGMPIVSSSASLTALQNNAASATDNEAAAVAFPTTGGVLGAAFPSIAQTSLQSQALNSLGFLNANQNFYAAYPYVSIGGAPVPSMGFLF